LVDTGVAGVGVTTLALLCFLTFGVGEFNGRFFFGIQAVVRFSSFLATSISLYLVSLLWLLDAVCDWKSINF